MRLGSNRANQQGCYGQSGSGVPDSAEMRQFIRHFSHKEPYDFAMGIAKRHWRGQCHIEIEPLLKSVELAQRWSRKPRGRGPAVARQRPRFSDFGPYVWTISASPGKRDLKL